MVTREAVEVSPGTVPSPEPSPGVPADSRRLLLIAGTSLTEGYGLEDPVEAWPARIQERIDQDALPWRVVNAGISGETSAGARSRIEWLLSLSPDVLVLETGGNDGLRGLPPGALLENLRAVTRTVRERAPETLLVLVPMEAPTSLGEAYTRAFREVYPSVASEEGVPLLPFLLDGVAGVPALNQTDGIHPTAEGHRRMAERVWPELRRILETHPKAGEPR